MHKKYQTLQYRNRRIMEEITERPIRPEVAIPLNKRMLPNKK
jgi:hypothetical protein